MHNLKNILKFGGILNDHDIELILQNTEFRTYKTGENLLQVGQVCHEMGFLEKGVFRSFGIGKNGEEVTKYLVKENQFLMNLESYYEQKGSDTTLQAVFPSEVYVFKRSVWMRMTEEIPNLFIFTKSLTESTLLQKMKDNDFLNFGTAQDKYEEFVRRYPDLALKVPQQYIASYLKITPQSLSRIRKNLLER